ncbi:hypothetical protein Tcan_04632 [Toxocara canis]|uniref:Uncharacterized protein n=1 Tax=Toxocara canis TaxID=6265 RepID=A0A0B2VFD9_TOXCA|nr:hypothetical protein Tcan_04632 [Toxocara canis]
MSDEWNASICFDKGHCQPIVSLTSDCCDGSYDSPVTSSCVLWLCTTWLTGARTQQPSLALQRVAVCCVWQCRCFQVIGERITMIHSGGRHTRIFTSFA